MSRYPLNPRTGRREPPFTLMPFFEFTVCIVLGFIVLTLIAGAIFCCLQLWALMLS